MKERLYIRREVEQRRLKIFKVDYVLGDFQAIVRMKSRRELEAFVLENDGEYIFEGRDAYFVISGGVLFLAEKKRKRKEARDIVLWT